MSSKIKAPYDEKNDLDYKEMSRRIADALEEIECNSTIPATQKELSKRAKCSRGTLRNRVYPLDWLKSINTKRKERVLNKSKKITLEQRANLEVRVEGEKNLLERLKNSRTEAAIWFDKYKESEQDRNKLRRMIALVQAKNTSLTKRNTELLEKLRALEEIVKLNKNKKVILPFPTSRASDDGLARKDEAVLTHD